MDTLMNYCETAKECSAYNPRENVESLSNSTIESTSCLNCKNWENSHCTLDLYDQINETE
ncbi:hypothetical protein HZI73_19350 [Vallitalea pronyensis]|uniref:Uncharacterized protein n=1 Tax=Vallitalea pronyensis TaxID=1348613 RepID=A0A8J8MMQ6_9FIRM|nr:hypothetical protein [Vallitalea pronyensis]QUI24319.1 hypothetical protein HZI73_19350 [Vallitalea pronyensis]